MIGGRWTCRISNRFSRSAFRRFARRALLEIQSRGAAKGLPRGSAGNLGGPKRWICTRSSSLSVAAVHGLRGVKIMKFNPVRHQEVDYNYRSMPTMYGHTHGVL